MLYIREANLAFIHVPKNAGKSVHKGMEQSAELSFDAFATDLGVAPARAAELMGEDLDDIPGLPPIKPIHLPLAFLRSHFPASFDTLRNSKSFILARHPRDRFFSALLQRLGEYRALRSIRADDPIVIEEARYVCEWLDGRGPFCDMNFIHFSRQTDYANLDEKRIVSAVFPVDRIDAAARWIEAETGLKLNVTHDHARREPQKWASSIQPAARFIGRKLLPMPLKKAIYPLWRGSSVFADAASRYQTIRLSPDIEDFIAEFYAADAALFDEAVQNAQSMPNLAVA